MGSFERSRRRQVLAALLALTIPSPLQYVRAWEPVHIDRSRAQQSKVTSTPQVTSPTQQTGPIPQTKAQAIAPSSTSATPTSSTTPAGPRLTAGASSSTSSVPPVERIGKVKPVRIDDAAPTPRGLDGLAMLESEEFAPVISAPPGATVTPKPIHVSDPLAQLDRTKHPMWSAGADGSQATLPAPSQPTAAAIVTTGPAAQSKAAYMPGSVKSDPSAYPSNPFAASGMLGGNGTAELVSATVPAPTSNPVGNGLQPIVIPDPLAGPGLMGQAAAGPYLASASLAPSLAPSSTVPSSQTQTDAAAAQAPAPAAQPIPAPSLVVSRIDVLEIALQRNPNIRVVSRTPQITSTTITIADAFFDPYFRASIYGNKNDYQLTDTLQSFGGAFNVNQRDGLTPLGGLNNLAIGQRLRTGGLYEVGVGTNYEYFDRVGPQRIVNPAWLSSVNLRYEQPLFEGRGQAIGESLIEIAQLNNRQSVETFRAEVNVILRNAEIAYWDLALLEQQAVAYRDIITKSEAQLGGENDRLELGDSVLPDVLESKDQYTEFLAFAATIETARREAAQRLANVLGYTPMQAETLRTDISDRPAPQLPTYEEGLARVTMRPELQAQRAAIRAAEVEVRRQINTLQPDLRMVMEYAITGLDEDLAGSMETVFDNNFNYAALGFVLQQPIGRRAEFAAVRRANLILCQERQRLEALEHQYTHQLNGIYQQLQAQAEVIRLNTERVNIAVEQYQLRLELRKEGEGDLDSVLRTQQRLALAETALNDAVYRFQQLLVQWQFEQGAIGDGRVAMY